MATGKPVGRRPLRPAEYLAVRVDRELKNLIGDAADEEGMTVNEWVARLAAKHFGRPDLATIPRKPLGRPRNAVSASA